VINLRTSKSGPRSRREWREGGGGREEWWWRRKRSVEKKREREDLIKRGKTKREKEETTIS